MISRRAAGIFAALGLAFGGGYVLHAQQISPQITVCVNILGWMRMVRPTDVCGTYEWKVSWNQGGPPGPKGDAGDPAPAGRAAFAESTFPDVRGKILDLGRPTVIATLTISAPSSTASTAYVKLDAAIETLRETVSGPADVEYSIVHNESGLSSPIRRITHTDYTRRLTGATTWVAQIPTNVLQTFTLQAAGFPVTGIWARGEISAITAALGPE
jgi:hypothetical protein